jgi:TolA-binding protein
MESLAIVIIGFFSTLVAFCTATIGYFKVWKPMQELKRSNGHHEVTQQSLTLKLEHYEERIDKLQDRIAALENQLETSNRERMQLKKENFELYRENMQLRHTQTS